MAKFHTFDTAWCPGCGNFSILECLKTALEELKKDPSEVLLVAGIGQAAKIPQYINANAFCGLHGRALPAATGAKIANEKLTVIVSTGDGDSYGEGGNHFLHNIRRNIDIAHFVHDNQVYGLTKGQASPTSDEGLVTSIQPEGNINTPLNPLLLAIAAGAGFVARGFTGNKQHLVSLMKQAIRYKGYALVDIMQPCVSFNKTNTYAWYNERVYMLDENYDSSDKSLAIKKATEFGDKIPIGIIFKEEKPSFHEKNSVLKDSKPLLDRKYDQTVVNRLFKELI
ncbi:MAG: 2-oxoacid:ferredoxin oxidoreductase subunit beta [Clostridia bacterium]|nr:2-oxoacid:ferredoxin oxidoreductase subunit beta [Clostridia bacterium]